MMEPSLPSLLVGVGNNILAVMKRTGTSLDTYRSRATEQQPELPPLKEPRAANLGNLLAAKRLSMRSCPSENPEERAARAEK